MLRLPLRSGRRSSLGMRTRMATRTGAAGDELLAMRATLPWGSQLPPLSSPHPSLRHPVITHLSLLFRAWRHLASKPSRQYVRRPPAAFPRILLACLRPLPPPLFRLSTALPPPPPPPPREVPLRRSSHSSVQQLLPLWPQRLRQLRTLQPLSSMQQLRPRRQPCSPWSLPHRWRQQAGAYLPKANGSVALGRWRVLSPRVCPMSAGPCPPSGERSWHQPCWTPPSGWCGRGPAATAIRHQLRA